MSAGKQRAVGVVALVVMAIVALVTGDDPSAYIAAIILVQVL